MKSAELKSVIVLDWMPVHAVLRGLWIYSRDENKDPAYCDIIAGQNEYELPKDWDLKEIIKIELHENDRTEILRDN